MVVFINAKENYFNIYCIATVTMETIFGGFAENSHFSHNFPDFLKFNLKMRAVIYFADKIGYDTDIHLI